MSAALFVIVWWLSGFIPLVFILAQVGGYLTIADVVVSAIFGLAGPFGAALGCFFWLVELGNEHVIWRRKK